MPTYGLYLSTLVHEFIGIYVRKLSKTYKSISFFGSFYTWSGASFLVFIITVPIFWDFLENIFNLKLGAEVWIYTFIVLSLVEFIIMLVISLKRTVNNTRNN